MTIRRQHGAVLQRDAIHRISPDARAAWPTPRHTVVFGQYGEDVSARRTHLLTGIRWRRPALRPHQAQEPPVVQADEAGLVVVDDLGRVVRHRAVVVPGLALVGRPQPEGALAFGARNIW